MMGAFGVHLNTQILIPNPQNHLNTQIMIPNLHNPWPKQKIGKFMSLKASSHSHSQEIPISSSGEVDLGVSTEKKKRFEEWLQTVEEEPTFASMEERFEDWMVKYKRQYRDAAEKEERFQIFKRNAEFVDKLNNDNAKRQQCCRFGTHQFSDMTEDEKLRLF